MAGTGKRRQATNGGKDFSNPPVSGVEITRTDVFPNLAKVETGFGVEIKIVHEPGWERRAAALFSRK